MDSLISNNGGLDDVSKLFSTGKHKDDCQLDNDIAEIVLTAGL